MGQYCTGKPFLMEWWTVSISKKYFLCVLIALSGYLVTWLPTFLPAIFTRNMLKFHTLFGVKSLCIPCSNCKPRRLLYNQANNLFLTLYVCIVLLCCVCYDREEWLPWTSIKSQIENPLNKNRGQIKTHSMCHAAQKAGAPHPWVINKKSNNVISV